ncbi:hypothetical protein [Pygmaiobacter massiliensis]|uniref:Ger(x)C family spore germination protein n=1 Tax=Pygmaiobacter massiliensis TaxID=1917873 RepID=UPI0011AED84A|nr:hypothetical protein [Pygmaiobacter massiliensis]
MILPILALFCLCGCGATTPLSQRAMVKMVTVHCEPQQYRVGLLYLTVNREADADQAGSIPHYAYGTGETVSEALVNAEKASGETPFYAQNELLMVEGTPPRASFDKVIEYFSEEHFSRTNMAIFCCDKLPESSEMSDYAKDLAIYTGQPNVVVRRVYDYGPDETALLPLLRTDTETVQSDGFLVLPVKGESFVISEQAEFAAVLMGENKKMKFHFQNGGCTVNELAISHDVTYEDQMQQKLILTGAICEVEGKLSEEELKAAVAEDLQKQFNELYAACYLANDTDLFAFDWWFSCYNQRVFQAARQAERFYLPDTMTLQIKLHME